MKSGKGRIMEIVLNILLLIAGFVMLIKGADFFVDGASGIAEKFGIPEIIVGLTIVAMGTSAPEAAVSIAAALKGNGDITLGNILGSNILNIFIILGITAIIIPVAVSETTVRIDMPFMILITVVLLLTGLRGGEIERIDGVILWAFFILYMGYLFYSARDSMKAKAHQKEEQTSRSVHLLLLLTLTGGVMIVIGSNLTVNAATEIAVMLGVTPRVIALTIVAFGTSLPELVTSVTAARKGNADIAIGNIVGSNIFNILFVVGTTALITDVAFASKFLFDITVAIIAAVLAWVFSISGRKVDRKEGVVMVLLYAAYLAYLLIGK